MSHSVTQKDKFKPFSASLFVFIIITSLSVYLLTLKFLFPSVWNIQVQAPLNSFILTFLGAHLVCAIFEHPFHRYVLHAPLIPGFSRFWRRHTRHHQLTNVAWQRVGVKNRYPIIEESQHESSFFPWYSHMTFALVLTPLFMYVQSKMPQQPIFFGGIAGLTFSIVLYELLHALEHKPLDWWIPKIEHYVLWKKKAWRFVYVFHLGHHADFKRNEGISGFFGIPIADFLFGTWVHPNTLYSHGTQVDREEFESPEPVFFIRWLDKLADWRIEQFRRKKTV